MAFATKYDILPNAEDPLYTFAVNTPVNNKEAKIHGFELAGQYFFGDSGFGVLANYTIVRGDIGYDVTSDPNENQFALLGLSDSANASLMFEKFGLSARLAYNWRDEYLQNLNVGQFRNPIFVEAYRPDRPQRGLRHQRPLRSVDRGREPHRRGCALARPLRQADVAHRGPGSAVCARSPLQVLTISMFP